MDFPADPWVTVVVRAPPTCFVGVEVMVFVTYWVLVDVVLLRLSFFFVLVELVEPLEVDEVVELDWDFELLGVEVQLVAGAVLV